MLIWADQGGSHPRGCFVHSICGIQPLYSTCIIFFSVVFFPLAQGARFWDRAPSRCSVYFKENQNVLRWVKPEDHDRATVVLYSTYTDTEIFRDYQVCSPNRILCSFRTLLCCSGCLSFTDRYPARQNCVYYTVHTCCHKLRDDVRP